MKVAATLMVEVVAVSFRMHMTVRMAMPIQCFFHMKRLSRGRVDRPMGTRLANAGHNQSLHDQQQEGQVAKVMTQSIEHTGKPE
jgi:hypothetical protein